MTAGVGRAGADLGPLAEHARALRHRDAQLAATADEVAVALHALASGPNACMPVPPPHGVRLRELAADVGRVAALAERTGEALAGADGALPPCAPRPAPLPGRGLPAWAVEVTGPLAAAWATSQVAVDGHEVAVGAARRGVPWRPPTSTPPGRPGIDFVSRSRRPLVERAGRVVTAIAENRLLRGLSRATVVPALVLDVNDVVRGVLDGDTERWVTGTAATVGGLVLVTASGPVVWVGAGLVAAATVAANREVIGRAATGVWRGLRGGRNGGDASAEERRRRRRQRGQVAVPVPPGGVGVPLPGLP